MREKDLLTDIKVANSRPPLKKVKKWIQQGWITGLISGFITLCCAVLGASGYKIYYFGILNIIDVFLILTMTFGIYHKSRLASTCMFVYYIICQIMWAIDYGSQSIGMLSIIFMYFYFQAMRGTFIYKETIKYLRNQALLEKEYTSELVNS